MKPTKVLLLLLAILLALDAEENPLSSSPSNEPSVEPPTEQPVVEKEALLGKNTCPCLTFEEANIRSLAAFQPPYLKYEDKGETYDFPESYGSQVCVSHDDGLEPYCDHSSQVPGNPDWCGQPWCWVDPHTCQESTFHQSRFFPLSGLFYSYDTCGGSNTFLIWAGDTTEHSFTDLVGLVERYLVSAKTTLENKAHRIQSFVKSTSTQEVLDAECSPLPACGVCAECRSVGTCWYSEVDLDSTTTILSPANREAARQDELNILACQTNTLSRSLLQVSGREYNDVNRIAYAYHGDQSTGALVQWPAIAETCVPDYDARFRPWYASALSGSKDVVMVIDVSGSMEGIRIVLAAKAAKAVLRTLTWVDYFNIITFNDDIAEVFETSLQRATEDRVADAMQWINDAVRAVGGTNFLLPLQKAYELLSQPAQDADAPPRCSQAILFLTDGIDTFGFSVGDLEKEREDNPNVVIFTYSLGGDAATDVLHELACASNGIFHRVNNAETLPDVMAAYYEYFVQLQDTCHITWIRYTGAFTDEDLLAGCAAVFQFDDAAGQSSSSSLPEVLGVTCIDLNLIVDLETLQSCRSGGFDAFVEVVRREAQKCSGRVMDSCVLAHLRERAGSTCHESTHRVDDCALPSQPAESNCSVLDPSRFQYIPLSGCSIEARDNCKKNDEGSKWSVVVLVIVGVIGGVVVVALVLVFRSRRKFCSRRSQQTKEKYPNSHGNEEEDISTYVGTIPHDTKILPLPTAPPADAVETEAS